MNVIFTTLVIASIVTLCFSDPAVLLSSTIAGAETALETSASLCAVYCLWLGLFNVIEKSNLLEKLSKLTKPLLKLLYGKIDDAAASYIALNMSANLVGVSNAATPSATKAIKILEKSNTKLSRAGAMLFVLNATSIQILPSTVMGLRAGMGSANAVDILLPTLISTFATTVLGVFLVNLAYGKKSKGESI